MFRRKILAELTVQMNNVPPDSPAAKMLSDLRQASDFSGLKECALIVRGPTEISVGFIDNGGVISNKLLGYGRLLCRLADKYGITMTCIADPANSHGQGHSKYDLARGYALFGFREVSNPSGHDDPDDGVHMMRKPKAA